MNDDHHRTVQREDMVDLNISHILIIINNHYLYHITVTFYHPYALNSAYIIIECIISTVTIYHSNSLNSAYIIIIIIIYRIPTYEYMFDYLSLCTII